jgi:protease II
MPSCLNIFNMKKLNFIKIRKRNFFNKLKDIFIKKSENSVTEEPQTIDYSKTKLHKELMKVDDNDVASIKQKYELYDKGYEKTDILKKDDEFGDIVKYSDFLEEGKEKFENTLTKYYSGSKYLEKNKEYMKLLNLVDKKSKQFYTTYKEEYKYNLEPTDEKWYKETIYSTKNDEIDDLYTNDNILRKKRSNFRSFKAEVDEVEKHIKVPDHPTFPTMVNTPFESYTDYFQWLYNDTTREFKIFKKREEEYTYTSLLKNKYIEYNLLEEFDECRMISNLSSMQISKNYIVYKKDNEDISLYFINNDSVEPSNRGNIRHGDYQSKEVFSLKDFIELNTKYTDVGFLEFSKKLLENIENGRDCLYNFKLCPKEQFLLLFFDLTGENKCFDILIKDIVNDVLLPVVIYSSHIDIAFDYHDGFYYTQLDKYGRPCKIFRHQIGKAQIHDTLIYFERNENLKLSAFNCNSFEHIYIEISTNYNPSVNEIWFKSSSDLNKLDFKCIKKMEKNIHYSIKYSNGYFYLLSNRSDTYDKFLQKIFISPQNISGLLEFSKIEQKEETGLTTLSRVLSDERKETTDYYTESISNNSLMLPTVQDIIKIEDNINIIDFQVFKNFLVILEEVDKKRHFKVLNLLSGNTYIHEPMLENMNVSLLNNLSYDSSYFRHNTSSPTQPEMTIDYSLGTRKSYTVHQAQYKKFDIGKYKTETMYIDDRNKEAKIPVILNYREDLFSTESPYILYTKGSMSKKSDLNFNDMLVKLIDRGFVWTIPQIRGTNFFDFDWYSQGVAENKIKHFTDFMDVAYFLIDNNITKKVILYGDEYSGCITATVALIQNPEFFASTVLRNSAFDLFDLCNYNKDISLIEEFGDINNKDYYDLIKLYSPYHAILPERYNPILITHDENYKYKTQAYKFIAKLRKKNKLLKGSSKVYLNELPIAFSVEEKNASLYSFIIGDIFFK